MKMKNKILTALVTICMLMFILPMAVSAADKKDTITCYVRAEQNDGTVLPYTKVTMDKNKVPSFQSYGIHSEAEDVEYITPMHILLQAMKDRGMTEELAKVDIGSSGTINDLFGWGIDQMFCVKGMMPEQTSVSYEAKDGEKYTFCQTTGQWAVGAGISGYGFFGKFGEGQGYTPKSAIETDNITTEVGKAVELTCLHVGSMHTPQYGPCNNEGGTYTKIFVGKAGKEAVTDEDYRKDLKVNKDGKFKVTFDKPGTYVVSARYYNADKTRAASNAYCKVTVKGLKQEATPKTITLSKKRFTYNGKTQKPKVTVKNAKGKVIPASNYAVKYSGKCKNVGVYKMTLTFKGDYKGTKTKNFVIEPKTTSIRSLKAGKKSFAVKWAKKTTQVSGYKVEYSTDKNFKKSVNSKVAFKNNSVSRKMKNLKAKKTYYVRVRTYKTVKYNGKNVHIHSKWSTVKKVTVK